MKHHGNTNVAGKDPDIHFGPARLTEQTPSSPSQRFQLAFMVGVLAPNFAFLMNTHFTGLNDVFFDNGLEQKLDVLPDRSPASKRLAWKKSLRKWVPYYLKNYVFFPLLAGPVLLEGAPRQLARRDDARRLLRRHHLLRSRRRRRRAATRPDTKAHGRGHWYAMQIAATNNYEVSRPISVLCGGLDRQIEHHLFPTLPPQRLREIAPEVRAICERHGIAYKTDTWGRTLKKALAHVGRLGRQGGSVQGVREAIREMA